MMIYHNLLIENDLDDLVNTQKVIKFDKKQYTGIMLLFNDIIKKEKLVNLLNELILSKINLEFNKCFLLINSSYDVYEHIKYKFNSIIKDGGISIGISTASEHLKDIPKMFREADISAYSQFFSNKSNIFVYYKNNNFIDIENIIEIISKYMDNKYYGDIIKLLKKIPGTFVDKNLNMEHVVLFWNQIVALIINKTKKEFHSKEFCFMNYLEISNKFNNILELCQYLIDFFSSLDTTISNVKILGSINENFKKLLEFVNEHYNEDLHLKELSHKYYINVSVKNSTYLKVRNSLIN